MNIVVGYRGDEYEVSLDPAGDDATFRLLAGIAADANRLRIEVDGRAIDSTMPLSEIGLRTGSRIDLLGPGDPAGEGSRSCGAAGVFNRPPRPVDRYVPAELELPEAPEQHGRSTRFGWSALVVPLVLGAAMSVLVHPRMALFALFSPVMLVANWFEDRRRLRRERRQSGLAFHDALQRFQGEVAQLHRAELAYRRRRAVRPGMLLAQPASGASQLWERRPENEDFMVLPVGVGCIPWQPLQRGEPGPETADVLRRFGVLHAVPLELRLRGGEITGIAGDRNQVLAAARQLILQAAIWHGPADLAISVFTEMPADWDWAKWLPHVLVDSAGRRRIAGTEPEIGAVAALLPDGSSATSMNPHHLLIVDLPDLVGGDRPVIREALRAGSQRGVAGLALAAETSALPSVVSTIVALDDAKSWMRWPDGEHSTLVAWALGGTEARSVARALARLDDPEATRPGSELPGLVHLIPLLELENNLDRAVEFGWMQPTQRPAAPIGVGESGTLWIDLVDDGPHALLGGTTGSGKSELLRTLIAGLAVRCSPSALNFVLIDYKGGSAFDACSGLPHTAGVVTDLDEHLGQRALKCLEAELAYRERRLRSVGVSDIAAYPGHSNGPLPRLLVVVDEFAALAQELPGFVESLVGIAQRGRSLGVHLLLATQRPSGVISDHIKANTNLRFALRMQDGADSVDVIGSDAAAAIGRNQPGRGLARRGPGDVVRFQTALVTGRSLSHTASGPLVRPFVFAHEQPPAQQFDLAGDGPDDLEAIVAASTRVARQLKLPPVRVPWPDVLPSRVSLDELGDKSAPPIGAVFALADEPHLQRQVAASWSPASGNLLLFGVPGSGTTTAVLSLVVGLSRAADPNQLHIYVLDFDDQALLPLSRLPHVGAAIGCGESERQSRLLRRLAAELSARRDEVAAEPGALDAKPVIVTILDNYGGFAAAFDEPGDMAARNLLTRLVADGPGVGMYSIVTAKHPGDVPTRVASLVGAKLAFRLADRYDYTALGIPAVDPPRLPGRAFESGSGRELQVAIPEERNLEAAVPTGGSDKPSCAPWAIDVLPQDVAVADVVSAARIDADCWFLPIGLGDTTLAPAGLVLRPGDHALIAGPARSGKSTALLAAAAAAKAVRPDLSVVAVVPRNSPLTAAAVVDRVVAPEDFAALDRENGEWLLLVDDAELVEGSKHLSNLVRSRDCGIRVVAAGAADAIRTLYGHWTQDVRRSRVGCALRPNIAIDGDLWQTPLPRRRYGKFPVGRGYLLADGRAELAQLGRL